MGRISYLLDSNILSEPARLKANDGVLRGLAKHEGEYATAAIVWHECWRSRKEKRSCSPI